MSIQENIALKSRPASQKAASRLRDFGTRAWAEARRHPLLIGAVLVALAAGIAYETWSGGSETQGKYIIATVARGDIKDSVTALGNLQPENYVDVGAQATGQLKKLYVKIGDTVKQGQLLAEIDPQIAHSKVQQDQGNLTNLQAQLADKQAQAALAQTQAARQKHLIDAGATSRDAYDTAIAAARSAAAEVNAVRAQIAAAQAQVNGDNITLGYTKIYAPMSGTIASISILQGQTINSVQQAPTILRIADLSIMEVLTQVSEADVPKLKVGMPAYFTTLGNPGKRWTGKLEQIQPTPTVTNNVVLYTATFNVANPTQELMTQMTAQVFFVTASAHNVVTVPVSALHQGHVRAGSRTGSRTPNQETASAAQPRRHRSGAGGTGGHHARVLVVKPDGTTESRRIVTGVSNRVSAEVVSGLQPGEKVVVGTTSGEPVTRAPQAGQGRNGSSRGGYTRPPTL